MKPNSIEDQHVWELEQSRQRLVAEAARKEALEKEQRQLKELHWMHCPKCGQKLVTENYGPVEIDLCPSCQGIWLDANELEKIVASEGSFLLSCLRTLRKK